MVQVLSLLALAGTALAHGGVLSYNIAGTTYKGFVPYNSPSGMSIRRCFASYISLARPTFKTDQTPAIMKGSGHAVASEL